MSDDIAEFNDHDYLLVGDDGWVGELPAPARLAHNQFEPVVDELKSRPGVWKVIAVYYKKHYAVPFKTGGLISQLRRAGCHVATRSTDGRKHLIYGRWPLPDQEPPARQPARHGTWSMYTSKAKCRCDECVVAARTYRREYKQRIRRGESTAHRYHDPSEMPS